MLSDQGSVFVSKEWKYNCELAKDDLRHTGTESHNSLGNAETYYAYLRRMYRKTRCYHSTVALDVCLSLSVKARYSAVGPDGLCPQLLVFGILPRLPGICPQEFSIQKERSRALGTALDEYDKLISKEILNRGLRSVPQPAADHKYMPDDYFYVYSERLKHYSGTHLVASVHDKQARLHVGENTGLREFDVALPKPAPLARLASMDEMLREDSSGPLRVMYAETIPKADPREHTSAFDNAKLQELLGLVEKVTFRIVLEDEVDPRPNVILSPFVPTLKHSETGQVK